MPQLDSAQTFGAKLFECRNQLRLPLRMAAERSGFSKSYLNALENDRRHPPPQATVLALCAALGLDADSASELKNLAIAGRAAIGTKVTRGVPAAVGELIRDMACLAPRLQPRHLAVIRTQLTEAAM